MEIVRIVFNRERFVRLRIGGSIIATLSNRVLHGALAWAWISSFEPWLMQVDNKSVATRHDTCRHQGSIEWDTSASVLGGHPYPVDRIHDVNPLGPLRLLGR